MVLNSCTNVGNSADANKAEAQQLCKTRISSQLKSPSTAKFDYEVQIRSTDPNDYRILTQVDAQNSFGAVMRETYTCDLMWSPSSESWRITSLTN